MGVLPKSNFLRFWRKPEPRVNNWLQERSQISQSDPWDILTQGCASISQKVFTKSFGKIRFPHKSVNQSFIISNVKHELFVAREVPIELRGRRRGCSETPPLRGGISKVNFHDISGNLGQKLTNGSKNDSKSRKAIPGIPPHRAVRGFFFPNILQEMTRFPPQTFKIDPRRACSWRVRYRLDCGGGGEVDD